MDINAVRSGHTPPLPETKAVRSSPENTEKAVAQEQQAKAATPPDAKEVHKAVKELQAKASAANGQIEFSLDQDSGREIVKVVDRSTKDVLMQFPSKQALAMAKALDSGNNGALINDKS